MFTIPPGREYLQRWTAGIILAQQYRLLDGCPTTSNIGRTWMKKVNIAKGEVRDDVCVKVSKTTNFHTVRYVAGVGLSGAGKFGVIVALEQALEQALGSARGKHERSF
jgi:hypothetical protein